MTTGAWAGISIDGGAMTERHEMSVTLVLEREGAYFGYGEFAEEFLRDVKDIAEASLSSDWAFAEAQDLYYGAIGAAMCYDNEQVGLYMLEAEDLLEELGHKVAWTSGDGYRIYKKA